jgi:hypothetical protein
MSTLSRARRFWIGFGLVLVVLIAGFGIANALIPAYGSTPEEFQRVLPGDEIFTHPVLTWNHAITIHASPQTVWPWIAQMGDTRAGYYSYRYIEKAVTAMAGVDTSTYYRNVNSVHPEWQTPPVGQGMIMDVLVLREIEPGQYLVAGPQPGKGEAGLLWTWYLQPVADGNTRLLVHMRIQLPGMDKNAPVEAASNLATFMMERRMMDGIRLHAEGGTEPGWIQPVEAFVWLYTLGLGLLAARWFLTQPDAATRRLAGWIALAVGLAAVMLLLVFTYLQPALWLRALLCLALTAALVLRPRGEAV